VVKIRFRIIAQPYKNGKTIYHNEEVSLNFPKHIHELLRFLADKKLEICGYRTGKRLHIELYDKEDP
jgi:hypothetical protein